MDNWFHRRQVRKDMAILGALVMGDIYVVPIMKRTGLGSGSVYVGLARLQKLGIVWSDHAPQPEGPDRVRYGITKEAWDRRAWETR